MCLPIYPYPPFHPFVYLFTHPPTYPSSNHPFIHLSIHPFIIYLFIYQQPLAPSSTMVVTSMTLLNESFMAVCSESYEPSSQNLEYCRLCPIMPEEGSLWNFLGTPLLW